MQIYLCIHEKSHNYTPKENSQYYRLIKQDQRVTGISKGAVQEGEKIMQSPLVRPQDLAYMLVWGEIRVC